MVRTVCRSKNTLFELLGKGIMLAVSGGGVMVISKGLVERMDKVESKTDESIKDLKIAVSDLKIQVEKSESSSSKRQEESDAKVQKLEAKVSELSWFKDVWLSTERAGVPPVVGTQDD